MTDPAPLRPGSAEAARPAVPEPSAASSAPGAERLEAPVSGAEHTSTTILAISGSLRRASINSAVLRAAAVAAARGGIRVEIADSLRDLPPFDPDLETRPPRSVLRLRKACEDAAGVLFAVPEYTFGIPGSFKNALDWTVQSGSLYRKPVTVLKISPPGRGGHVREALEVALRAHGADVVHRSIRVSRPDLDARGEVSDPRIITELRGVVVELGTRVTRPEPSGLDSPYSGGRARRTALWSRAPLSPGLARRQRGPAQRTERSTERRGARRRNQRKEVPMATVVQPFTGTYELDRNHSMFQFAVTHMKVSTFRASFADIDARLTAEGDTIELEGRALAESVSIAEPPEFREHVVRGTDFFDADAHPLIGFRSTSVELEDDGSATVTGELTIRGVSRSVAAHGTYQPPTEDPFGGYRAGLELRATVDRRNWDMNWQIPLPDGSDALGWEVEITAQLELTRND
jgi:polyisoprenoid-binding protein YceI/NAD(P)H-dependent FMN reductase